MRPALLMVATDVLPDNHEPLVDGVTLAVPPTQTISSPPSVGILGIPSIPTEADDRDIQLLILVTVKV